MWFDGSNLKVCVPCSTFLSVGNLLSITKRNVKLMVRIIPNPPCTTSLVVESRYKSSFYHVISGRVTLQIFLLPSLSGRVTFHLFPPLSSFYHDLVVESRFNCFLLLPPLRIVRKIWSCRCCDEPARHFLRYHVKVSSIILYHSLSPIHCIVVYIYISRIIMVGRVWLFLGHRGISWDIPRAVLQIPVSYPILVQYVIHSVVSS